MKTKIMVTKSIKLDETEIRKMLKKSSATVKFYSAILDHNDYGPGSPGYATVTWTEEEEVEI